MGLWSRLIRWKKAAEAAGPGPAPAEPAAPPQGTADHIVEQLPIEPFVFECRDCGKVFEARRIRPSCPECDSRDVALLSE